MTAPVVKEMPTSTRQRLVQAMRRLTPKQRLVLRRWAENPERSIYSVCMEFKTSKRTPYTWLADDRFNEARALIEQQVVDAMNISAAYILGRTRDVVERSMQAEPVRDREGNPIGEYTFEGAVALKGLDMLGKHRRLWQEDKTQTQAPIGPGLTVIVQTNGPAAVAAAQDGPRGVVHVNLPGPER